MTNNGPGKTENKRITRLCPKCGKKYSSYPAVSRDDGITEICPECGAREALIAAGIEGETQEKVMEEIAKAYKQ